ncbi:MAG: choice-of-anchor J domain-containing protein, partial [Muribaculaceae bacterium]
YYLNGSAYVSGTSNASEAWAISPIINLTGATSITAAFEHAAKFQTTLTTLCGMAVREEGDSSWTMLTIPTWPTAGAWTFANSGDISLSAYAGKKIQLAFKYGSTADGADTWEIRNLKLVSDQPISVEGAGDPTPTPDPEPADDTKGQFNTFNDGTPKSTYGTYTNATGWTATNCNILSGVAAGGSDTNPRFAFIGNEKTLAPTLNGKVSAPGSLESPTLTGGINTLTFNYGFAYSDTKCSITIQVLQNGTVVKEDTLELTSFTQKTAYEYSWAVNVSGDFQIRIVNNSLSAADANKDRISIWNLTWD